MELHMVKFEDEFETQYNHIEKCPFYLKYKRLNPFD